MSKKKKSYLYHELKQKETKIVPKSLKIHHKTNKIIFFCFINLKNKQNCKTGD